MSPPAVCPSCARLLAAGAGTCAACGWVDPGPHGRTTKEIPADGSVRLARIGLVKGPLRIDPTLELPGEITAELDGPVLELPPESELEPEEPTASYASAGYGLEGEPPTNPYATTGFEVPAIAVSSGANPIIARDELPDFPFPPAPHPDDPALLRPTVEMPVVSAPSGLRPALDLPPEDSGVQPAPSAPRPRASAPRASGPRTAPPERVSPPSPSWPGWLTEPITNVAVGVGLCGAAAAVQLLDLSVAGRPFAAAPLIGVLAVLLLAAAGAVIARHRLALGLAGAAAVVSLGLGLGPFACALVWAVGLGLSSWGLPGRVERVGQLAASLAVLAMLVPVLDGLTPRPLFGRFTTAPRASWPVIDQHSGLQLLSGSDTLRPVALRDATLLIDAHEGYRVKLIALPRGTRLDEAPALARAWLESSGLQHVELSAPEPLFTAFDVGSMAQLTAAEGRSALRGIVECAVLGDEAFALAVFTRAHRFERLAPGFRKLLDQLRYRPPRRPRLPLAVREQVATSVLTAGDGTPAARVAVGRSGSALITTGKANGVTFGNSTGRFPIEGAKEVTVEGLTVVSVAGAQGLTLRASANAPRLTRVVVATGASWVGGWLTDEPGATTREVLLLESAAGPAFDLEGALIGFVTNGPRLITAEQLQAAVQTAVGPIALAPTNMAAPPPLFEARERAPTDLTLPEPPTASVLLARSSAGISAATVIDRRNDEWILIADGSIAPAGTTLVTLRLPSGVLRAATIARATQGAALLTLPQAADDGLLMTPFAEGHLSGRRSTFGFREDPATGTPALRGALGHLADDDFDQDPGPVLSPGPIFTADSRVAAWRRGEGQPVVHTEVLQRLTVPAIRDVAWRLAAEASGTCQLSATIMLEDPLSTATLVRARSEPATTTEVPSRLISAAVADAIPKNGEASFIHRLDCPLTPLLLQFEVQADEGTAATPIQRLDVVTVLPEVVRGRTGPSAGATPAPATFLNELWVTPPPLTLNHECRATPSLCERACAIDQLEACTLDGREALQQKEVARAISVLDPMCGRGELEACVVLLWALDGKARPITSKPAAVVEPWCTAGLSRACAAIDRETWKRTLKTLTDGCATTRSTCDDLGRHLLDGPRLDLDVTQALGHLKNGCAMGQAQACTDYAREGLRFAKVDALTVIPALAAPCRQGIAEACTLEALNPALGLTVPRNAQAAEQVLRDACRLGSRAACLMRVPKVD